MANILFVNTSHWSFGELMISIEFAADVIEHEHKVLFLVPNKHIENVERRGFSALSLIPKSRKFNLMQLSTIKNSFAPDLIVTADFINFAYAYRHYEIDVEDLLKTCSKLATFDIFDWGKHRQYPVDVYGLKSKLTVQVDVGPYLYRFLPCPICNPTFIQSEYNFSYSIMNRRQVDRIKNMLTKEQRKIKFGLPIDKKVIMVSFAEWQANPVQHPRVERFVEISNKIFETLIRKLSETYKIITVGVKNKEIFNTMDILHFNSMNSEDFDNLALATDLYISRNITSTTMARLFCLGVNSVCIVNSKLKITLEQINKYNKHRPIQTMLPENADEKYYKYMMFPVGWYNFLEPLIQDNQYYNAIELCELFDIDYTLDAINKKIFNSNSNDKKWNLYIDELASLLSPNQIIDKITKE